LDGWLGAASAAAASGAGIMLKAPAAAEAERKTRRVGDDRVADMTILLAEKRLGLEIVCAEITDGPLLLLGSALNTLWRNPAGLLPTRRPILPNGVGHING
jgi:hypothetical protein